ncbi:hypothetical protein O3P69_002023 [Scylla paramamosain]|uniref:Uncharacterized protein n=1 Tax=Scylla paramamosain TaxID=85552 RepID=A0AAW0V442_SCYPA
MRDKLNQNLGASPPRFIPSPPWPGHHSERTCAASCCPVWVIFVRVRQRKAGSCRWKVSQWWSSHEVLDAL